MAPRQTHMSLLPIPSGWTITVSYGNRPTNNGILTLNSMTGSTVTGTVNFRGVPIPIHGTWNEQSRQLRFSSLYAVFNGVLTYFHEPGIMHYMLKGHYRSTVGYNFPGAIGQWEATTAIIS